MKRQYLRLFRYQLYREDVLSLEEVEPLGPLSGFASSVAVRRASSQYSLDHFGMRNDIRKLYEQLDKGIGSLDSRVKPGKVNQYFIGYGATGSYFCNVKPRVNSIRVEVKCRRKPPTPTGLKVRSIPDSQHTPMTHAFDLTSERQLRSGLNAIKGALEDSM
jgi:predicted transport protein